MTSGLTVHVAEDLNQLADVFTSLYGWSESSVLAPLWTVVPSAPIRQWLDWRLAERIGTSGPGRTDGIAANLTNLFPEEFVRRVERAALYDVGADYVPWDVDSLTLRLMATSALGLGAAKKLAAEIDDLIRYRPETLTSGRRDDHEFLSAYQRLGTASERPLAQREAVRAVLRDHRPAGVPDRVVLYGLATVPGGPSFAQLVADVAHHARVDLLLLSPSGTRAADIVHERTATHGGARPPAWWRVADEAVELWRMVAPDAAQWHFSERPDAPKSRSLARVQAAMCGEARDTGPDSDGLTFIGATGIARQLEVLRDVLLRWFAHNDGSVSDVLIVTPDPARVADALERHWSRSTAQVAPTLPYEMTETEPADARDRLGASAELLDLICGPVTAQSLASFVALPVVATALGWGRRELDRLAELIEQAPVTFGVSPAQPERTDVYGTVTPRSFRLDTGTWQRGCDRVVLSVLYPPTEDAGAATLGVPSDLGVVEGLQPLLRTVAQAQDGRTEVKTVSQWLDDLAQWLDAVAAGDGPDDPFAVAALRVRRMVAHDVAGRSDPTVSLAEFAELWRTMTRARPAQRVFGRYGVTVSTLEALAFAPHRVVCLVGFDEELFPAATLVPAALRPRRVGDPDARHSLLANALATVLSAREQLVVTFSDRREDDGRPRELATPLEELLDVVTEATGTDRLELVRTSARHGFSVPAGSPGMIDWTYDPRLAAVAPTPTARAVTRATDPGIGDVDLADLRRFYRSPSRYYFQRTLNATLPPDADVDAVFPPIAVSARRRAALQRRYVNDLVAALLTHFRAEGVAPFPDADHDPAPSCAGELCDWFHEPVATLRRRTLDERAGAGVVPRLWARALDFGALDLASYNLAAERAGLSPLSEAARGGVLTDVDLTSGSRLISSPLVRAFDDFPLASATGSTDVLSGRFDLQREGLKRWRGILVAALDLVVLKVTAPELAVTVAASFVPARTEPYKKKTGAVEAGGYALNPRATLRFAGSADDARAVLGDLVALYERAQVGPLPLFPRTAVAAATAFGASARSEWGDPFRFAEGDDAANQLLFPLSFDELLALGEGAVPFADSLSTVFALISVEERTQSGEPPRRTRPAAPRREANDDGAADAQPPEATASA